MNAMKEVALITAAQSLNLGSAQGQILHVIHRGSCSGPCFRKRFMLKERLNTLLPVKHPSESFHYDQG